MDGGINIRMAGLNQQSTELVGCLLVQVWWSVSSRDVAWHPCGAEPIAFPDEDQSSSPPWRCLGTKAQERPDDRGAAHAKARLSFSRMHRQAGIFLGEQTRDWEKSTTNGGGGNSPHKLGKLAVCFL